MIFLRADIAWAGNKKGTWGRLGLSFEGWVEVEIAELGRIVTGKTPSTKDSNNFGSKYPFITPKDMKGQKYIRETERYLSEKGKKLVKNCILPENTVCISCIGSDMGKIVMVTEQSVTNQQLNSIVVNENNDPHFIYYAVLNISDYLRSVGFQSTAVPILNKTQFSKFKIYKPHDIEEQRAIARILSSLDDKMELNNRMNKTLEEMAQAIFKSWFVDFEPFKDGEFEDSELGRIPKGWRVVYLPEMIVINPVRQLCKGTVAPYVEMKNIPDSYARIKNWDYREYKQSGAKFKNEDVLLARITPCLENGKTAYVDFLADREIGWGSTEFIVLAPKESTSGFFIYFLARSERFRDYAIANMTGTSGRQRVPTSCFDSYKITLPEKDVLDQFNQIVKSFFSVMKKNDLESKILTNLRDALLPKLMSGEIRVPVDILEKEAR